MKNRKLSIKVAYLLIGIILSVTLLSIIESNRRHKSEITKWKTEVTQVIRHQKNVNEQIVNRIQENRVLIRELIDSLTRLTKHTTRKGE